jgi:hypothetical protein
MVAAVKNIHFDNFQPMVVQWNKGMRIWSKGQDSYVSHYFVQMLLSIFE